MEAWEMMKQPRPDPTEPQPSLPVYFNKADEKNELYCEEFIKLHPEVDDPMRQEIDEMMIMLTGGSTPHGRPLMATGSFKPDRKYTQIKATLPSGSSSGTARSRHPRRDVSLPHFHPLF